MRLVTPQPCGHDAQIESTIGTSAGTMRKFAWTRRGSTYAYRLGNELRRLAYGLGEVWRERFEANA